jgi:ribose transport system ATP-binding protein
MPAVLAVRDISKTYPGLRALHGVDLEVAAGEIHGLVGGNGSGKSTLLRVLAGVTVADPGGTIEAAGRRYPVRRWSPGAAAAAGLRFVHQDPGLFPALSVAENLALGGDHPTGALGRIRWRRLYTEAAQRLAEYGLSVPVRTPVARLAPGERTWLAIVRAVQGLRPVGGGLLCLDEPTAALPAEDVARLFAELRGYAAAGHAVVYVSHRLDEVLALADRVTVLRDGRRVATGAAADLTERSLIAMISGSPGRGSAPPPVPPVDRPLGIECTALAGGPLRGVSLHVNAGEVVGVAGPLGSGRSTLLRMLFGAYPVAAGQIRLAGKRVHWRSPAQAMQAGVAYVPERREADGIFRGLTVRFNLTAADLRRYAPVRARRRERGAAAESVAHFAIATPDDRRPVETLSGGNQQKVLLARWLRRHPRVLLLDEPTRGVDAATRAVIYSRILQARQAGTAILLVASDLAELAAVCDRIALLHDGRVAAIVDRATAAAVSRSASQVPEVTGPGPTGSGPHQAARVAADVNHLLALLTGRPAPITAEAADEPVPASSR